MKFGNALIDLGASVNIIPLSVVKRIWYMQIKSFASTLQMEEKTCRTLVGTIKDVLIQIDKFTFPIDFVILDIKEDPKMLFILRKTINENCEDAHGH